MTKMCRTYIVHLPTGYSSNNQYPIVLNIHGLISNATIQQSITQFDNVADSKGFIVVYPNGNGLLNNWVTNGNSDVDFLSNLVDTFVLIIQPTIVYLLQGYLKVDL